MVDYKSELRDRERISQVDVIYRDFSKAFDRDWQFFQVFSGVPQGAHCSQLFFNIFVNDLNDVLENSTGIMYADDLKLYREIPLPNWPHINNLKLNIEEC